MVHSASASVYALNPFFDKKINATLKILVVLNIKFGPFQIALQKKKMLQ